MCHFRDASHGIATSNLGIISTNTIGEKLLKFLKDITGTFNVTQQDVKNGSNMIKEVYKNFPFLGKNLATQKTLVQFGFKKVEFAVKYHKSLCKQN